MLVSGEVKGELARIHPARACDRRSELAGLLFGARRRRELRTLDHATARTAVHLAASLGWPPPAPRAASGGAKGRHHLVVALDLPELESWRWTEAAECDRRAFLRGVLLASGSVSAGRGGAHVEFVFPDAARARLLQRHLAEVDVQAAVMRRRGRHVVYVKGLEEIGMLLRLAGANRALLDFETARVGRDVRNRLNRLLNAEEANLGRTVRAADRQLQAIARLEARGELDALAAGLREVAVERRRQPDADLDTLASALGLGRSAVNHRLRRLVELANEES